MESKKYMTAEEYLLNVRRYDTMIDNKLAEIDKLKRLADSISPELKNVVVSGSRNVHRVQDIWNKIIDLNREATEDIDRFIDYRQEVINTIQKLPVQEYDVLHKHYVQYMTWDQVASAMHYSLARIMRIRKKALLNLSEILQRG